jgi:hypothetical protein
MTDQDWWRQQVEQQLADLPNSARGPDAQKSSRLDHPGATSTAPEKFRAGVCDRPAAQLPSAACSLLISSLISAMRSIRSLSDCAILRASGLRHWSIT